MKYLKSVIAAGAVVAASMTALPAKAAIYDFPVASNAYITQTGLDWAWARPLPGGIDFSVQGALGWRLPTAAELASSAPLATDFLFTGANVPFNGVDPVSGSRFEVTNAAYTGAGACAAAYFSSFLHCDWQDGLGQTYGPWAGMRGARSFADQLVVRVSAVPVPGAFGMLFSALVGGAALRRRKKSKA